MNAIIVDDTPTAIDTLAAKLGKYGDITLAATATNGSDGIELVKKHKPELIFLPGHGTARHDRHRLP